MADEMAMVRVGHFSPDAPAVDVYANGGAILTEVPFGVLSDYLEVPGGTYTIEVVAAGAEPADGAVIGPVDLEFAPGTMTTVAATNALASIEAQVLTDEPNPQDGIAQVRVVTSALTLPRWMSRWTVVTWWSRTSPTPMPPATSTCPRASTTSRSGPPVRRTWPSTSIPWRSTAATASPSSPSARSRTAASRSFRRSMPA